MAIIIIKYLIVKALVFNVMFQMKVAYKNNATVGATRFYHRCLKLWPVNKVGSKTPFKIVAKSS
jgi:hypothetical protein